MSCTQAKACGYHQNGIMTQSPRGEGRPFIPPAELGGILAYFDKKTFSYQFSTTPTNSVYGTMQDGYVERFDQKISPRPSPSTSSGW
jgi:hypothetical protein